MSKVVEIKVIRYYTVKEWVYYYIFIDGVGVDWFDFLFDINVNRPVLNTLNAILGLELSGKEMKQYLMDNYYEETNK